METIEKRSAIDVLMCAASLQLEVGSLIFESDNLKQTGNIPEAITAYERLILKCRELEDLIALHRTLDASSILQPSADVMLNAMSTLADLYESLGDFSKGERVWNEIQNYVANLGDDERRMEAQRLLAVSLQTQGRFSEALTKFTLCHDFFMQNGNALRLADVTGNLAEIYEWLGDFERSSDYVNEADSLLASVEAKSIEQMFQVQKIRAGLIQTAGRISKFTGDYDDAWISFEKVKALVPHPHTGLDFQHATLLVLKKDFENGVKLLERIEPELLGISRRKRGVLLSWKAESLMGLQKFDEALKCIESSLADQQDYYDPDSTWRSYWRKARIHLVLNQKDEALAACAESLKIIDNLRKGSLGYRFDNLYLRDKMPVVECAIDLAYNAGNVSLLCSFMEIVKSRTLTSILNANRNENATEGSELEKKLWTVTRRLDQLEFSSNGSVNVKEEHEHLLSERERLIERIRFSDHRWHSLSAPVAFNLKEVQRTLGERDQSALNLFLVEKTIYAVLITGKESIASKMQIDDDSLRKLIRYQNNFSSEKVDVSLFDLSVALDVDAGELIPADVLSKALDSESLIIVPHKFLHLVPWAGVIFRGKRLFEYCPVAIVPNLGCLTSLYFEPVRNVKVALLGAPMYPRNLNYKPLPESVVELELIRTVYNRSRIIDKLMIGRDATVENFWKLVHHPDSISQVMHLAAHGRVDGDNPSNACLIFSDGKVDTARLMLSQIKYAEAVLSACSTGYRPDRVGNLDLIGDDILSLPGSLLEGGVRSVLVSIPPARDDVTTSFMVLYHTLRSTGISPLLAFQQTQKGMAKKNDYPVCLWIGFTMYGVI